MKILKKIKNICHICRTTKKAPEGQPLPAFCDTCGANLANPNEEATTLETAVESTAGGLSSDLVWVFLTNKRVVFHAASSTGSTVGGAAGGLIGAAISAAIDATKQAKVVSVPLQDITSTSEEIKGLFKNKIELTLHTKDGGRYSMKLSKKEAAQWQSELSKHIA